MAAHHKELRLGADYVRLMRGVAVIGVALIALVGLDVIAWGPQPEIGYFVTLWAQAGGIGMGLGILYEAIWQSIGPVATLDASGLTYRTRWGLRRVCFADVVRAEFGIGGQLRFDIRDGRSCRVDLGGVPVAERDPALAYVRSRLPDASCVDIVLVGERSDHLLHVAWNVLLWLASAGLVEIGYAARQWVG